MIELSLLKTLSIRLYYESYLRLINPKTLSKESIFLLKEYKEYFASRQSDKVVWEDFNTFLFIERNPNMDDKSIDKWKDIIHRIQAVDLEDKSSHSIINAFKQQEFYAELHRDLDDNRPLDDVLKKIEVIRNSLIPDRSSIQACGEEMDLGVALDTTNRQKGLQWRLECLNQAVGPVVESDFILFAAFVGTGKTSFMASEASNMAQQLTDNKKVLWFNNEGNWKKILLRTYCAVLNCTEQDLRANPDAAKKRYIERMNGDPERIKVFDIKGKNTKDIENLVEAYDPGLIIVDMLDKVAGYEIYLKGESGATERYNQLYAWAEHLSDRAPLIATSQLNGDGYNTEYPDITKMRGSRVDKQANAAAIIVMGAIQNSPHVRFLSTPKNKLSGNETFRTQVQFDALRSRYKD